jgi:hypothetical protein
VKELQEIFAPKGTRDLRAEMDMSGAAALRPDAIRITYYSCFII